MHRSPFSIRNLTILLVLTSCQGAGTRGEPGQVGDSLDPTTGNDPDGGDGPILDTDDVLDPNEKGVCGDTRLTKDEACDDGNTEDGDGCSADCLNVAPGYSCNPPGKPCHQVSRCGDGSVNLPELCDDGNAENGDGCSDLCKVEIGWKCEGEPTSSCTETVCGDGVVEGAEGCDDGNDTPLDGCDERCQKEPECPAQGPCTSECGDGLVLGEGCDDGNNIGGDGCSAECTIEDGFMCGSSEECEMIGDECILRVHAIFRDFLSTHPDFEPTPDYGCITQDGVTPPATLGMVQETLGADGKPQWAAANCATESDFDQWYRDVPGTNVTILSSIPLFPDGAGGFVNRYGPMGEKFIGTETQGQVRDEDGNIVNYEDCQAMGCVPCRYVPTQGCEAIEFDGTPLFFPIDDVGEEFFEAKIPAQYGWDGWPWESEAFGEEVVHNFHFTSEITYWFVYDEDNPSTLNFTGDDDVWVFVNGTLAVDLGGVHPPVDGSVTLDPTTAATYGLEDGSAYKLTIFHAERKVEGSSFRLTLKGFNASRSECRPECGDGIIGLGEECDDGVNDGGYGECTANCLLGEYCGDGIEQEEYEDCDDGNFFDDDECPASCRRINIE